MTLPPIPKDRNWSPETWRAGLDEAVRLCGWTDATTWAYYTSTFANELSATKSIIAHATTLIDAGIVKPVISEAVAMLIDLSRIINDCPLEVKPWECPEAIAIIQSALDKARSGQ